MDSITNKNDNGYSENDDRLSLAIIEDNKDLCDMLNVYIQKHYDEVIEVVGIANDGSDGINLLVEKKPDVALIDIVLPVLDGLSILERLNSLFMLDEICCIMLSAVSHDNIIKRAVELGAKYYILKPFDNEALIRRMFEITRDFKSESNKNGAPEFNKKTTNIPLEPEKYANYMLQIMGIPPNLTGYYYLRRAIVLCIKDESMLNCLTKVLYPQIGKDFKTTSVRVERAMRHSIEKAWNDDTSKRYYTALGRTAPENISSRPSNGILIMDLVDFYKTNYRLDKTVIS